MKKIKKIIMILLILIILLVAIIWIISKLNSEEMKDGIGMDEYYPDYSASPVKNASVYYTVEYYVQRYLDYVSLDINKKEEENEDEYVPDIHSNEEKYEYLYGLLDDDYIKNNNITLDNISKFIKVTNKPIKFTALKINEVEEEKTRVYAVYGRVEDKEAKKLISYSYFKLKFDIKNNTFSIEPVENCQNINEINLGKDDEPIEKNGKNIYGYLKLTEKELLNKYMDYYQYAVANYPEEIYNILDVGYKSAKFKDVEEFKKYISNRKKVVILDKYKSQKNKNETQYTCIDTDGNYYIINQTSIMQFSLILDLYTTDIPEFIEKYYNAEDTEKVALNIQKVFEAMNDKDYNYIYEKLADGFKEKYFKTVDDFEKYIKENFFEKNEVDYLVYKKESEEYYSYIIDVYKKGTKDKKRIKIIMELKSGTDYVFSFNVE